VGQLAGVGVLKGGMIAGDDGQAIGQREFGAVAERQSGARGQCIDTPQMREQSVKSDPPQTDHDAEIFEQAQFLVKQGSAIAKLFERRLIPRGCAAGDGTDPQAGESHAVVS